MSRPLHVEKLSDEFGLYTLRVRCTSCGHVRSIQPSVLARRFSWTYSLVDLQRRLTCTRCGSHSAVMTVVELQSARGRK